MEEVLAGVVDADGAGENAEDGRDDEGVIIETQLASFIAAGKAPSCRVVGGV
jgi:hypothetical protein